MYRKLLIGILLSIILSLSCIGYSGYEKGVLGMNEAIAERVVDVTDKLEDLGIPFSAKGYARNVWDMQILNCRLYLGHGNSNNYGPNPSEGPIPIYYYDIGLQKFVKQYMTNEDQLSNLKILDGQLYVPGLDPRDSWDFGNFYRISGNNWEKIRTVPKAVHIFDMVEAKGKLYAATGSDDSNVLYQSQNYGKTWTPIKFDTNPPYWPISNRMYTLFNLSGKVYATSVVFDASADNVKNKAVVIDGANVSTINIFRNKVLPGASKPYQYYKLGRGTEALGQMVYISQKYDYYDLWLTEALYHAPDLNSAARVSFPEGEAIPMDLAVRGNTLYVMTYVKRSDSLYTNIVYKTEDFSKWTEVLRFNYNTFARSFEEVYGSFYFGMGCYVAKIPDTVGKILRVSADTLFG